MGNYVETPDPFGLDEEVATVTTPARLMFNAGFMPLEISKALKQQPSTIASDIAQLSERELIDGLRAHLRRILAPTGRIP